LSAATLAYLAAVEHIHVAQATIFSQFAIDFGDGDGGSPYPYYPSTQHYLKPAQGAADFIDVVALDGWTVDLLCARRAGMSNAQNSRMGVGPIETLGRYGAVRGHAEQMATTAQHFDNPLNGDAFVTSIWEIALMGVGGPPIEALAGWLAAVRARWPDARLLSHGAFGLAWRAQHAANDWRYEWANVGTGLGGSDAGVEERLFVNRAFRLALLKNASAAGLGAVIDFTDFTAATPLEPSGRLTRDWNYMTAGPNWKQSRRGGDAPRALSALAAADQALIKQWLPQLFA